ncbi:unnamed protein product [Closterium sp. NIES-53]
MLALAARRFLPVAHLGSASVSARRMPRARDGFFPPARPAVARAAHSPPPPPSPPPMGRGGESVRGWRMCLSSSSCRDASSSLTAASAAAGRGCEGVADVPQQQQLLPRLLPSHGCACCCGGSGGEGVKGWRMFVVRPAVAHATPAPPPRSLPPPFSSVPLLIVQQGGEGMGMARVWVPASRAPCCCPSSFYYCLGAKSKCITYPCCRYSIKCVTYRYC